RAKPIWRRNLTAWAERGPWWQKTTRSDAESSSPRRSGRSWRGNELGALEPRDLELLGRADVEERDVPPLVLPALEIPDLDVEVVRRVLGLGRDAAELGVVDQLVLRRMLGADRAVGVLPGLPFVRHELDVRVHLVEAPERRVELRAAGAPIRSPP